MRTTMLRVFTFLLDMFIFDKMLLLTKFNARLIFASPPTFLLHIKIKKTKNLIKIEPVVNLLQFINIQQQKNYNKKKIISSYKLINLLT